MQRQGIVFGLCVVLCSMSFLGLGFPTTLVDDRGQEVVIQASPQRIVSLNALYTQIMVDLGLTERLVALADSEGNPADVSDLPSVGPSFSPNVELILGHEPDLVLGATDWGGERPALEAADVTVFTTAWLTDVASIFETVDAIARAVGATDAAERLVGRIAREIVELESAALGKPEITAAFLYASTRQDPPYAAGGDSIEHELILRAGGVNVFSDLVWSPQVGFEEILARNPQVIFTDPAQIQNIVDNVLLQSVDAVVEGRVIGIRASDVTSTRIADALRAVLAGLHDPEE